MESTPPYHRSNTKSASRLQDSSNPPNLSLDLVLSSPNTPNPSSPVPLRDILLLPPSPLRKSRTRLSDRLEMTSEDAMAVVRKRGKGKGGQKSLLASPRNPRRSRRRSEAVEEKEANLVIEEIVKLPPRKRKTNGRPKKDKQSSAPPLCSSSDLPNTCQSDLNLIGEIISDLVMWRDVAKSTLWFGFGCSIRFVKVMTFFFVLKRFLGGFQSRTCVTLRVLLVKHSLSKLIVSVILQCVVTFRKNEDTKRAFHVTPFLLLGAEYGHLITLWRLSAFGFFLSFTIPKLYSCYTHQISQKVERVKTRIGEAWGVCSHKKILAGSAVTAFWNLTSIRTRIFAVFIILVIFRYRRQNLQLTPEEVEPVENEQEEETLPQEEETVPQEEETVPQEEEQTQPSEERALVVVVAET
nr:hypothetical protein [Arabidopsis thaliana]